MSKLRVKDERLSNGSIIYWSRRFKRKKKWYVPVQCGDCGEERAVLSTTAVLEEFSGLCRGCSRRVSAAQRFARTKPQTLPDGSTIYWSRRFEQEGQWYIPIRCGGCRQERIVTADNANKRRRQQTGLCPRCSQGYKFTDETLSTGSVVYWSRRFKGQGSWLVPVRCGKCGQERAVPTSTAGKAGFSGLCRRCSWETKSKMPDADVKLANGSIIYWSRRHKTGNYWSVPVRCGNCGEERSVTASNVSRPDFSGLCFHCGQITRRLHTRTGVESLPTGSLIYWDDEIRNEKGQRFVRVKCGGPRCGGQERYCLLVEVLADGFTGLCMTCGHSGPRTRSWKGGRIVTGQGYVMVLLDPDHPFYCMTNARGYVLEHRLIMAQQIGRPLRKDEIVHHLNHDRQDNRPENLELYTRVAFRDSRDPHPGYQPVKAKSRLKRLWSRICKLFR